MLDAAIAVFVRYGLRKTTMSDIAREAQVSRQTLYGRFGDKDGILCAAMHYLTDQTIALVQQDWAGQVTLAEKLDSYFQHTTLAIYAMLQNSPDADDIISGANPAAKVASAEIEARKEALLVGMLAPWEPQFLRHGESALRLARLIAGTATALKHTARSEAELRQMLETLRAGVLCLAGQRD